MPDDWREDSTEERLAETLKQVVHSRGYVPVTLSCGWLPAVRFTPLERVTGTYPRASTVCQVSGEYCWILRARFMSRLFFPTVPDGEQYSSWLIARFPVAVPPAFQGFQDYVPAGNNPGGAGQSQCHDTRADSFYLQAGGSARSVSEHCDAGLV